MARWMIALGLAGCGEDAAYRNLYAAGCATDIDDPESQHRVLSELWNHPTTRKDLETLAAAPVRERGAILARALRKAGLDRCQDRDLEAIEKPTYFGVELAVVQSTHLPLHPEAPVLRVTETAMVVEGQLVTTIDHGVIDSAAREGGVLGRRIIPLVTAMEPIARRQPDGRVSIAFDRQTPYRLVIDTLYSSNEVSLRRFDLLVDAAGRVGAVQITLPYASSNTTSVQRPSIGLVVSVAKDKMLLWSMTGLEGTLQSPLESLAPTDTQGLAAALLEIRARRWPTGERARGDRSIMLMLDGELPAQRLLEIAAAIAFDATGGELFPEVILSAGFE